MVWFALVGAVVCVSKVQPERPVFCQDTSHLVEYFHQVFCVQFNCRFLTELTLEAIAPATEAAVGLTCLCPLMSAMRFSAPDCVGEFAVAAQFEKWWRSYAAVNGIAGEILEDGEGVAY
jgi:hypothetical protein